MANGRLAEVLGALSLATDMSAGNPPGSALTATALAVRIGNRLGLPEGQLGDLYYACITRFIGCTSTSEDTAAAALGDELTGYLAATLADPADSESLRAELERSFAPGQPEEARQAVIDAFVGMGPAFMVLGVAHCAQAVALTRRLPVPSGVPDILARLESRWDDLHPVHPPGPDLLPATRIIEFCVVAELHRRVGGLRSMVEVADARAGGQFDPEVVKVFLDDVARLTAGFARVDEWSTYLEAEPGPPRSMDSDDLRRVAEAFADFTDNKSRWFIGHSRQVAGLSYRAALDVRAEEDWCQTMFNAALLHDIGKCAIVNGIWDKTEPLTPYEVSIARQHPSHTEHMLSMTPVFGAVGEIACSAHERADGSGYHRRTRLEEPRAAILAAANLFDELTTQGPRSQALDDGEAAEQLLAEVSAGRLPREAVRGVLDGV
ncbi:MAG: HD domain-containing protein, partial [Hyphomicrobiales bacterium]|nr:HD domain-containing protein [Hyphomicrobiales bacterium]